MDGYESIYLYTDVEGDGDDCVEDDDVGEEDEQGDDGGTHHGILNHKIYNIYIQFDDFFTINSRIFTKHVN